MKKLFLLLCLIYSYSQFSLAQPDNIQLHLAAGNITVTDNTRQWFTDFSTGKANITPYQVIISFNALPSANDKTVLLKNGIRLLDYIPDNSFIALVSPGVNVATALEMNMKGVTEVRDNWKMSKALWQALNNQQNDIELTISFYAGVSKAKIEETISFYGGQITGKNMAGIGIYHITMPMNKVKKFAGWYGVAYIQQSAGHIPLDASSINTQRADQAVLPILQGGAGLSGAGITVGVGDNTSAIYHTDMKDRVINYNPAPEELHGIHTSGIAAGSGILDPKAVGMAPEASIVSQYYTAIWEQTPEYYAAHNMTLTNNSYASAVQDCNRAGVYDNNSVAIDKYALEYDKVLHVFAAGNDGNLTCAPFPEGFSAVSGSYQPAKNNIVVSSTDRYFKNKEVTSASGPVKDGRLKPEISALGAYIMSGDVNDGYNTTLGTSQASPQVLGGLALLSERYKQIHAGETPRGDILKAIILNSASDVENPGPDFSNGFGFLNIKQALRILNNTWYREGTVNNNGQEQIDIIVDPNTTQLKVMLCWHDAAASPLATKALVNDLDLEVRMPNNTTHLPLVLDPDPAKVKENAVEKADHLNNTEQVVINNPGPGKYTVNVKGFNVPSSAQRFVIAYTLIRSGISLTYPVAGCSIQANDTAFIYWEASEGTGNFTLEYSTTDGVAWNVIDSNIPATQRHYVWLPGNISSGMCKARIKRNGTGEVYMTDRFVISPQPEITLDAIQCPGYMQIKWSAVPNATSYEVLQKKGIKLQPVDTVTSTTYTFSGLPLDSVCIAAVRPLFFNLPGYRSKGLKRIPNDGNCAGNISDGDLMIEKILRPNTGRKFTSTALLQQDTISLQLRNLDDVAQSNFRLSYSINGGAWTSNTYTNNLAPNTPTIVDIPNIDLSLAKSYDIRVAVENLATNDPVSKNDSFARHIISLDNDPINIPATPFTDSFEDMAVLNLVDDSMGISPNEHWDYANPVGLGHFRSFGNPGLSFSGNRSISLDATQTRSAQNQNEFTGTFNIPFTSTAVEIRMEFSYIVHGIPRDITGNKVWTRGSDKDNWQEIFTYNTDVLQIGRVQHSGSLSLSDAVRNGFQQFSPSTQLKFEQNDSSVISFRGYGSGLTIDDVKIYSVVNDADIKAIISPARNECNLNGEVPVTIEVYNGVSNTMSDIRVSYRLDSGDVVTETIPSLSGKQKLNYTFAKKMSINGPGIYRLDAWVVATGDSYHNNDSILDYTIQNQPLIKSFPYKEDFELNNGYWYTDGVRSSWQYGKPASTQINMAASGTKAWKTNLAGNYNNLENSYLYSPCFDVSALRQPVFRFSNAMDLENCGDILCDAAYIEYSANGADWAKLGTSSEGYNWYDNANFNVWTTEGRSYWQNAHILMPDSLRQMKLRFVMSSDLGLTKEGIAIDDVEVFDYYPASQLLKIYPNPARNGSFNIKWTAPGGTELSISVVDVLGNLVHQQSATAITNAYNETAVSIPAVSPGVYFVRCIIGDATYKEKIVFL